jgi:dihydroxyacid dehydratase/phosphogluconate dehydratase
MGVATCDKGLPAMMMALAAQHDHPTILVPGGVMLAGAAVSSAPAAGASSSAPRPPRRWSARRSG